MQCITQCKLLGPRFLCRPQLIWASNKDMSDIEFLHDACTPDKVTVMALCNLKNKTSADWQIWIITVIKIDLLKRKAFSTALFWYLNTPSCTYWWNLLVIYKTPVLFITSSEFLLQIHSQTKQNRIQIRLFFWSNLENVWINRPTGKRDLIFTKNKIEK